MKIILAGIIGRYPWGGVTWCSLMYLLGLRQMGHEVWYLEDTCECNYDPSINSIATDPGYALRYLDGSLRPFGLGDRWCYVDYMGNHHGTGKEKWLEVCRSADLLIVLSGGVWTWRDEYLAIGRRVFIDSDPAFTQLALARAQEESAGNERKAWYVEFFQNYTRLFTFGRLIGTPDSDVPTAGFEWIPTSQPVTMNYWTPGEMPARNVWSTVMTWVIESFQDVGGNKDDEFLKILPLASQCRSEAAVEIELAVNGPRSFLTEQGWRCIDAFQISSDLWRYAAYVTGSRGEFSVAKRTYVSTRSGWFSDRTECYLAAGRPAVVQDTGFSRWLPTGEGVIAWNTLEEAREAILRVESDYDRHARAARELAVEYFSCEAILPRLLERSFE